MFYVYLHCRPDGTPFYVGKGRGRRAFELEYRRNPHHRNIIAKYGAANIVIQQFPVASEAEAFALECQKIAELRAAGVKLANQTDGGEGAAGRPISAKTLAALRARKGTALSAEHRAKISSSGKGRIKSPEECEKLRQALLGKKRPPHVIEALRAFNTGRKLSEERRAVALAGLAKAQEAAKAWHASEEGRAWHVAHGKAGWVDRPVSDAVCQQCGATFETPFPGRTKYCSNKCKTAARYASGVDNEQRACGVCGQPFMANKYQISNYCGKPCQSVAQGRTKRRKHGD
jgi:hypothetical protein